MDILCKNGYSFFKKFTRDVKGETQVVDFDGNPSTMFKWVHTSRALLALINALRQLEGQVVSKLEAERLNVVLGSVVLDRKILNRLHLEVIKGLMMLEGSLSSCHLNPLLHRLVHYVEQTAPLGCFL